MAVRAASQMKTSRIVISSGRRLGSAGSLLSWRESWTWWQNAAGFLCVCVLSTSGRGEGQTPDLRIDLPPDLTPFGSNVRRISIYRHELALEDCAVKRVAGMMSG